MGDMLKYHFTWHLKDALLYILEVVLVHPVIDDTIDAKVLEIFDCLPVIPVICPAKNYLQIV